MSHDLNHSPASLGRAFAIGIGLNLVFVVIETFYGWKINSLALLADAGHNLSDVAGLVLAWGGALAGNATRMAGSVEAFWRHLPMLCCCSWPWGHLAGRQ